MSQRKMTAGTAQKQIAVLCFDQMQALDLVGPTDVLHCAASLLQQKRQPVALDLRLVHPRQHQVRTSSDLGIYPSHFKMQNSAGDKSALGKATVGSFSGSKATTVNAA